MVGKSPSARTAILARTAKEKTSAKIAKLKKQNLQNSLVCEQMDVAAVDAFAAFIIVYTFLVAIITVDEPPHPADTARLARHPRLAVLLLTPLCVNRWMLSLLTALLLLFIVSCFTDKSFDRTTRLPRCSDKLVAS